MSKIETYIKVTLKTYPGTGSAKYQFEAIDALRKMPFASPRLPNANCEHSLADLIQFHSPDITGSQVEALISLTPRSRREVIATCF